MFKRLGRVVKSFLGQVRPLDTELETEKESDKVLEAFEKELKQAQKEKAHSMGKENPPTKDTPPPAPEPRDPNVPGPADKTLG